MTQLTVPTISIVFMAISAFGSFLIPMLLLMYYKKTLGVRRNNFFWGVGVYVAVSILELIFIILLRSTALGASMYNNIWLNGLLSGLCAGIFEELGRYFAFCRFTKGDERSEALAYGAGHGGAEAVIILGVGMLSNLTLAYVINSGTTGALMVSGTDVPAAMESFRSLVETPPYMYIIGLVERCLFMVLHLSLSVLVFAAAKRGRTLLLPAAIGIHALVNAVTTIVYNLSGRDLLTEGVVLVMTAATAYLALKVYYSISEN